MYKTQTIRYINGIKELSYAQMMLLEKVIQFIHRPCPHIPQLAEILPSHIHNLSDCTDVICCEHIAQPCAEFKFGHFPEIDIIQDIILPDRLDRLACPLFFRGITPSLLFLQLMLQGIDFIGQHLYFQIHSPVLIKYRLLFIQFFLQSVHLIVQCYAVLHSLTRSHANSSKYLLSSVSSTSTAQLLRLLTRL